MTGPSSPFDASGAKRAFAASPTRAGVRALLWALVVAMAIGWLFPGGGLENLRSLIGPNPRPFVPEIGRPAPPLRLPVAGGGDADLVAFRGKVVIINFWATWCIPCRAEMPAIERSYQAHRWRGFEVLGVDVQERESDVVVFLKDVGVTFPSAIDRTGEVVLAYRANALPTTVFIDREGIVRDVHVGPLTAEMLDERLDRLLAS
jgi:cytochrome c biogenesis protein CcmG, thiol:disulfide interchange protein DsbE